MSQRILGLQKKITGHIILDFLKKSRVFTKKYRDKIHNYPFKYFLWNFITFEKICKKVLAKCVVLCYNETNIP